MNKDISNTGVILKSDPVEICTRGQFSTVENRPRGPYFHSGKWTPPPMW